MAREQARPAVNVTVPPDSVAKLRLYAAVPADGPQRQDFRFVLTATDREGGDASEPARFERPQ